MKIDYLHDPVTVFMRIACIYGMKLTKLFKGIDPVTAFMRIACIEGMRLTKLFKGIMFEKVNI